MKVAKGNVLFKCDKRQMLRAMHTHSQLTNGAIDTVQKNRMYHIQKGRKKVVDSCRQSLKCSTMLRPMAAKKICWGHRGCDRRTTSHCRNSYRHEPKTVRSNTPWAVGTVNKNVGIQEPQNCSQHALGKMVRQFHIYNVHVHSVSKTSDKHQVKINSIIDHDECTRMEAPIVTHM